MNFLYKKAILCSEKIFLPILFSIISASSSDYVLNTNFGEPIHFTITANSQSNDVLSAKESSSIRLSKKGQEAVTMRMLCCGLKMLA